MGKRNQEKMTGLSRQERINAAIKRELEQERKREEARLRFLEITFGIKIRRE